MKKLFLWLFLCGVTLLFGQGKLHFTTTNAGRVNLYKFEPAPPAPYTWPGTTIANPSIKFYDAAGGGFYSDNISSPQTKFILNSVGGSGLQTGNIPISQDTWGQYNGSNSINVLMTASTMNNAGIVKFASGGYPGS